MADKEAVVRVEGVTKSFKIPLEASTGLKQKLINALKGRKGYKTFTSLKDVSFNIEKGDFFGIVGRNGSGKSTLLKTIAGIYTPTKGAVHVDGKIVPFIELGVGFNPELTGRENVFLNGALLGFSHAEMETMYDDIVDFAELHDFMAERLKNYSSGMQVRLAFSIAIRAKGNVLLLDEVLAVGDEAFQKKCYSYFDQLKRNKQTVVLVTHDMAIVERFCNKAIFIEKGVLKLEGRPHKVAAAYSRSNDESYDESLEKAEKNEGDAFKVEVRNSENRTAKSFDFMDTMTVKLKWDQPGVHHVGVAIFRDNGEYVFGPNTFRDKYTLQTSGEAEYSVTLNLNEGEYFLKAALMGKDDNHMIAFIEEGPHFTIKRDYSRARWGGVTHLEHEWR
ncbi:MAG TPA: ABC transporter ATP-binding protein [Candidatus Saccharimonadales bacterium]|nr:ABC transporter ATP-binding protein [Candidatus Saccharimonadales bacterium]